MSDFVRNVRSVGVVKALRSSGVSGDFIYKRLRVFRFMIIMINNNDRKHVRRPNIRAASVRGANMLQIKCGRIKDQEKKTETQKPLSQWSVNGGR